MAAKQIPLALEQRLSESVLWEIQRAYFVSKGMLAWQADEVPHAISCSPFMAGSYCQLIFGYLFDCLIAIQQGEQAPIGRSPIYFIELGAGSGRLTYHIIQQFYSAFLESPFADWPIKFILTDFAPETLYFWQNHAHFQPLVEADLLDFAFFDAAAPQALTLLHSGETISPTTAQSPIVLFANYFFDSIPQDSVSIVEGCAYQNLLNVYSTQSEPDLADPTIWERLRLEYVLGDSAEYTTPLYQEIIDAYAAELPETVVSFPNLGLDCIQFWQRFDQVLLLTSDRGHTLPEALINDQPPIPNLHGSFSLMVNYHAIGEYVHRSGGMIHQVTHYQDNIQTVAYHLCHPPNGAAETARAFQQTVATTGPDDFFALQAALRPHLNTLPLPQVLSLLRMSLWDADLFLDCFLALHQYARTHPEWHADIYDATQQVWNQYLPLIDNDPLLRHFQQLLMLTHPERALLDTAVDTNLL